MIHDLLRFLLFCSLTVDKLPTIPDSQDGPVYPGAQLQVLGLTQVPPFLQPLLHTAMYTFRRKKKRKSVLMDGIGRRL